MVPLPKTRAAWGAPTSEARMKIKFPVSLPARRAAGAVVLTLLGLLPGAAHAALQGRDLNADGSFDAYYDTVLNITWLKDANAGKGSIFDNAGGVPGSNGPNDGWMNYQNANAWAANLDVYGVTGWRLPTVRPINGSAFQNGTSFNGSTDNGYNGATIASEMGYMFYVNLGYKATCAPSASGCPTLVIPSGVTANMGPFTNIQSNAYWTNVDSVLDPAKAMSFGFQNGFQWTNTNLKTDSLNAWAVHDGDVSPVPEPGSVALLLAGMAMLVPMVRRRGTRG